jgi:two-component system response regulator YesN
LLCALFLLFCLAVRFCLKENPVDTSNSFYKPILQAAAKLAESLSICCGVSCYLLNPDGIPLFTYGGSRSGCGICKQILSLTGTAVPDCEQAHSYGAQQSLRFGGPYFYLCRSEFAWCASPIVVDDTLIGSLNVGPVLIMDIDDYVEGSLFDRLPFKSHELWKTTGFLSDIPKKSPGDLTHISHILFSVAVSLGDNGRAVFKANAESRRRQVMNEQIQQLKIEGTASDYPVDKEKELAKSVAEGDRESVRRILNELLGHILFMTGGDFSVMRTRFLELISLLSRTAIDAGADLMDMLALNHRHVSEGGDLKTAEDLMHWITRAAEDYCSHVFELVDSQHKDIIYKAISHLKQHFSEKITLQNTAALVGYSPAYLSRVFKKELDKSFNEYLTEIRLENSKFLLRNEKQSVGEIGAACGFEDQSYFIRVFRKHYGITPGKYRKTRVIDRRSPVEK